MRKLLILFFIISGWLVKGQNQQLLYNFEDLPQSLLLNPAAEPTFDFHVGVPLLSKASFSAGTSGVTLHDIYSASDTTAFGNRVLNALRDMGNNEFLSVHQQLELLSVGWRGKSGVYYSAGIYQETDAFVYIPRDIGLAVLEGYTSNRNSSYSFSDVAFTAEVLNVYHFGISMEQSRQLTYGVRGKLYSSALNIQSVGNGGEYYNLPGSRFNTYLPYVTNAHVTIRSSGLPSFIDTEGDPGLVREQMTKGLFFGGGLGVGLDLGMSYKFDYNWRVTGSILDLGVIAHFSEVETYNYWGDSREGVVDLEYTFPKPYPLEEIDEFVTDLEDIFLDETTHEAYLAMRPLKLNAAVDYGWGEDVYPCDPTREQVRTRFHNYVGVHLFSMLRPKGFIPAASLYYDGKIMNGLRGKVTYTVDSFSYYNLGAMMSAQVGPFNVYLAADNLLGYSNLAKSHGASLQVGAQFIFD